MHEAHFPEYSGIDIAFFLLMAIRRHLWETLVRAVEKKMPGTGQIVPLISIATRWHCYAAITLIYQGTLKKAYKSSTYV